MLVLRSLLMAAFATVVVVAIGAAPAHATQTPGQIENEIDKQWNALEPTIENYDAVHAKYLAQKAKADKLQKQIAPLEVRVQVALSQVNRYSTSVFENGPSGTLAVLLNSGGSENSIEMLGLLDAMASQQQKQVAATLKLQQAYQKQKQPIDVLVASLNNQQAELNQQQKTIKAKIAALNKLRLAAYGDAGSGTGSLRPVACPYTYTGDQGSRAARFACEQIGKPYVWDTSGPNSYDCSGLTMASWRSVGVTLPHNAYQQKYSMPSVSFSNLRPGDLVFYYPGTIHHVGIYVGGGWIVNAPRTGEPVQMARYNHFPLAGYGRPNG
jgi:peptidoglycan DL-endopeptidase CwlO